MTIPNIHNFIVTNLLCAGVGRPYLVDEGVGANRTCKLYTLEAKINSVKISKADTLIDNHEFYYTNQRLMNFHEIIDSLSIQGNYIKLIRQALNFEVNFRDYFHPSYFQKNLNTRYLDKLNLQSLDPKLIKAILRSNVRRIEEIANNARNVAFNANNQLNNYQYQHNLGDACLNDFADSIKSLNDPFSLRLDEIFKPQIITIIDHWRHLTSLNAPGLGAGLRTPGGWFAPKYGFTDACNGYIPDPRALARYPKVIHQNMTDDDLTIPSAEAIREKISPIHNSSWVNNFIYNNNNVLTEYQSRLVLAMAATMCFANGANRIRYQQEYNMFISQINSIIFFCGNIFAALHICLSQAQNPPCVILQNPPLILN